MARKPKDTVQLKLRFPEALRRRLEKAAAIKDQSMNSEIIERLESSFHQDRAAELIALAMQLETTDERNWKDDPLSAQTVRIAADRIIAGIANLPREHPRPLKYEDDPQAYDRETERLKAGKRVPAKDAEVLAAVILRKIGVSLPTRTEANR
jgi:Arc-like DNA binding dprotein